MVSRSSKRGRVRLRCSLRYRSDGSFPIVIGFPFARLDIDGDNLRFSAGRLVPFHRPRWQVSRSQITKIEHTQQGVRFYAAGFNDPWSVASIFPRHLLRKLSENGIVVDGPIIPTTWNSI